jgi:hypothetical protein
MCLICDHLSVDKITLSEARKNVMELRVLDDIDSDHYEQVLDLIKQFQKIEDDKKTKSVLNNA